MKKLISLLCVMAMLLSVCTCAFADDLTVAEGETYVVEDGNKRAHGSFENNGTVTNGKIINAFIDFHIYEGLTNNGTMEGDLFLDAHSILTNNGVIDITDDIYVYEGNLENNGDIVADDIWTDSNIVNDGNIWADYLQAEKSIVNTGEIYVEGSVYASSAENTGILDTAKLYVGDLENTGIVYSNAEFGATSIENYGAIIAYEIFGICAEDDFAGVSNYGYLYTNEGTFCGVYEDSNGEYSLLSTGLGAAMGEQFTTTLSATSGSWQCVTEDADMDGKVFSGGEEVSFLVKAVMRFLELIAPEEYEELICWMDAQVEKVTEVIDEEETEMTLTEDYFHAALTTFARCIIVFDYNQLQHLTSGTHTYHIYLTDGSMVEYTLTVE